MSTNRFLAALLLALTPAAALADPAPAPKAQRLYSDDFAARPSDEQVEHARPAAAVPGRLSVSVDLDCGVTPDALLTDCRVSRSDKVVAEGDLAALGLAARYKLKPEKLQGRDLATWRISVGIYIPRRDLTVEEARNMAANAVAASGDPAAFENVTDSSAASVRHKASGLYCVNPGADVMAISVDVATGVVTCRWRSDSTDHTAFDVATVLSPRAPRQTVNAVLLLAVRTTRAADPSLKLDAGFGDVEEMVLRPRPNPDRPRAWLSDGAKRHVLVTAAVRQDWSVSATVSGTVTPMLGSTAGRISLQRAFDGSAAQDPGV